MTAARPLLLLPLALALLVGTVEARIYRVVKPDGTVEFTNAEVPGGVPVTLSPTTIVPGLPVAGRKSMPPALLQTGDVAYSALTFASPRNGYLHRDAEEGVMVSLAVLPALGSNDEVRLLVNGEPWGVSGQVLGFELTGLAPGEHTLQAQILNGAGKVLVESRAVVVRVEGQRTAARATTEE